MSAQSIAWYEARIAELTASEDHFAELLGREMLQHAASRLDFDALLGLASELAEVLEKITPADYEPEGRFVVWGASDRAFVTRAQGALDRARKAGLLADPAAGFCGWCGEYASDGSHAECVR